MTRREAATAFFIALRFVFSPKKIRIINLISGLSIGGLTLGVAIICIVLSVLNGFRGVVTELFLTIDSEVDMIAKEAPLFRMSDWLLDTLISYPEIIEAEPFLSGKALAISPSQNAMISLRGVTPKTLKRLNPQMVHTSEALGPYGVALGIILARDLQVHPHTPLRLLSPEFIDDGLAALQNPFLASLRQPPAYTVENIFSSHRYYDDHTAIALLESVQLLRRLGAREVSGIALRIDSRYANRYDFQERKRIVERCLAQSGLDSSFTTQTLEEKHSALFEVMALEKWGSFAILLLAILISSLSLIASLTMTAIEKRRELYFLWCIGYRLPVLQSVFLIEGALVATGGVILGNALAFSILWLQLTYGIIKLPYADGFIISSYPVLIEPVDFIYVSFAAFFISLCASIYPAYRVGELSRSFTELRQKETQ